MKRVVYFGSMFIVAIMLGVGSVLWYFKTPDPATVRIGAWEFNPNIGKSLPNSFAWGTTALRGGFLASHRSEAIYFGANEDSDGKALTGNLRFRIEVQKLPARWWSITVYDSNNLLIPNDQKRYSFNSSNIELNSDGNFVIHVSPSAVDGNWLPTGINDRVKVVLRLYNPAPSVVEDVNAVEVPRIIIEGDASE